MHLLTPDSQVTVSVEGMCRTLCSGNHSCVAYEYDSVNSTCYTSAANGTRVVQTNLNTDQKAVYVKKSKTDHVKVYSITKIQAPG